MIRIILFVFLVYFMPRDGVHVETIELPDGWTQINNQFVVDEKGDTLGINYYHQTQVTFQVLTKAQLKDFRKVKSESGKN